MDKPKFTREELALIQTALHEKVLQLKAKPKRTIQDSYRIKKYGDLWDRICSHLTKD